MAGTVDGIEYAVPGDPWAYANQQKRLAETAAARIAAVQQATEILNDEVRADVAAGLSAAQASFKAFEDGINKDLAEKFEDIQTAYDVYVAQEQAAGRVPLDKDSWLGSLRGERGPAGPYGGTAISDPQLASLISDGAATKKALDTVYRRAYSVKEYGAKGDGITDDTAAIQRAVDTAPLGSDVVVPEGNFAVDAPIEVTRNINFVCNGELRVRHNGVAVAFRKLGMFTRINCTHRVNVYRPVGFDLADGAVGVEVDSCYNQEFFIRRVTGFSKGLWVTSDKNKGAVYNVFVLGALTDNKTQIELSGVKEGVTDAELSWQNQNTFIGGRIHWTQATNVPREECTGIKLGTSATDALPNGNIFLNTSVEDIGKDGIFATPFDVWGRWNGFYSIRMEGSRFCQWRSTSMCNYWVGGLYGTMNTMVDAGKMNTFDIPGNGGKHFATGGGAQEFVGSGEFAGVAVRNITGDMLDAISWFSPDGSTRMGGIAAAGRVDFKNVTHRFGLDREAPNGTRAARRGDICWNLSPASGGFVGWVCVAAGTPGTWKGFGYIEQ